MKVKEWVRRAPYVAAVCFSCFYYLNFLSRQSFSNAMLSFFLLSQQSSLILLFSWNALRFSGFWRSDNSSRTHTHTWVYLYWILLIIDAELGYKFDYFCCLWVMMGVECSFYWRRRKKLGKNHQKERLGFLYLAVSVLKMEANEI